MADEISDILFERVFETAKKNGVTGTITLRLGKPYASAGTGGSTTWRCPYQMIGIIPAKIHEATGVDALDALLNSVRSAEDAITAFGKANKKRITWRNEDRLGLSVPTELETGERATSKFEELFEDAIDNFFQTRRPKDPSE